MGVPKKIWSFQDCRIYTHFSEGPSYFHLMTQPYRKFAVVIWEGLVTHSHMIHSYSDCTWLLLQQCLSDSETKWPSTKLQGNNYAQNKWNNNLKFLHDGTTFNIYIYKAVCPLVTISCKILGPCKAYWISLFLSYFF